MDPMRVGRFMARLTVCLFQKNFLGGDGCMLACGEARIVFNSTSRHCRSEMLR
jgi:hypothetical protein